MRTPRERFLIRKDRVRAKIKRTTDRFRMSIFRSGRHIYAQIFDELSNVVVSSSTLDQSVRQYSKSSCNVDSAAKVGRLVAERALKKGVTAVVFDRSGYRYHGVVKAVAEAARQASLEF